MNFGASTQLSLRPAEYRFATRRKWKRTTVAAPKACRDHPELNTMATSDKKLEAYIAITADRFVEGHDEVADALGRIKVHCPRGRNPLALQLLALRRYLRLGGERVHAQWAWTMEEQRHFSQIGEAKLLMDEARKAQANFALRNPGYTLVVSPLRSLESQVIKWDTNDTVTNAGRGLLSNMSSVLESLPDPPTGESAVAFSHKLRFASVAPEPSSAAPGTSDHGQGRAVDFVIKNGAQIVADTQTTQIGPVWKLGVWEQKLIAATNGTRLAGPLQHPYEPWHWWLDASKAHAA